VRWITVRDPEQKKGAELNRIALGDRIRLDGSGMGESSVPLGPVGIALFEELGQGSASTPMLPA
jgi:hypothetical protein